MTAATGRDSKSIADQDSRAQFGWLYVLGFHHSELSELTNTTVTLHISGQFRLPSASYDNNFFVSQSRGSSSVGEQERRPKKSATNESRLATPASEIYSKAQDPQACVYYQVRPTREQEIGQE